ncbi:LOB domain-containing protein [Actinidia chinensis var. chinensis]|uniref:LOB domain-containing protein n=1 Tax=Actinidia chinensis var. chinensis TaxID=1590841 RepID=A0A2R6P3S9_ACTCC|nr:LOB domain-containing protein [Actinidia chinensis var. chinensis]
MRSSCNACRVLRQGCSDQCSLRACLHWIKSPESQANATIFLAKFYGRTGLINLINAGPHHHRPAIFRSLLYEACGRIINPVYGSVGMLCSGNWLRCQAAVDSVLNGSPIMQAPSYNDAAKHSITPLKGCDILRLSKNSNDIRTRTRFKRSGGRGRGKSRLVSAAELSPELTRFSISGWGEAPSHDSNLFSVDASLENLAETNRIVKSETRDDECEVGLELSLGFNQVMRSHMPIMEQINGSDGDA